MADTLSPFWLAWRAERVVEIINDGYCAEEAETIAGRETRARALATRLVGKKAALESAVITEYRSDGTYGVYVQVDRSAVPKKYYQRAQRWADFGKARVALES